MENTWIIIILCGKYHERGSVELKGAKYKYKITSSGVGGRVTIVVILKTVCKEVAFKLKHEVEQELDRLGSKRVEKDLQEEGKTFFRLQLE